MAHTVAAGTTSGHINVWNSVSGELIKRIRGHTSFVIVLTFNPTSDILASGGGEGLIKLWNFDTCEEIMTLSGHEDIISTLCFNSDGETIVSGSFDNTVRIWNTVNGESLQKIAIDRGTAISLAIEDTKNLLAIGVCNGSILIWDMSHNVAYRTLSGHNGPVKSLKFWTDRVTLISSCVDTSIKLWNINSGEAMMELGHGSLADCICGITFSPDGQLLASIGSDSNINVWDYVSRDVLVTIAMSDFGKYMTFNADSSQLLVSTMESGALLVFDPFTGERVLEIIDPEGLIKSIAVPEVQQGSYI